MTSLKKTLAGIVLAACCLTPAEQQAQPWYGQQDYPHGTILSSAKRTFNAPGYVMAGFGAAFPDMAIDKTDPAGGYAGMGSFSTEYQVQVGCPVPGGLTNFSGVSIIETGVATSLVRYAIAGASDEGLFFATLDAAGNVINKNFWPFQSFGFFVDIKKPGLRESPSNPGQYYICGNYDRQGYVVKVDINANQIWGNWYSHNLTIHPRDLMESPYNRNDLIVVGRIDVLYNTTAANAFFMRLDANTGTFGRLDYYNLSTDNDDWFACIQAATGGNGLPDGYILGGRSLGADPGWNNVNFSQWMCRTDMNGNIVWSSLIEPNAHSSNFMLVAGSEITNVYERFNPLTAQYEYYGVAGSYYTPGGTAGSIRADNLVVFKLDNSGQNSLVPNEFHYLGGWAPSGSPIQYLYGHCDLSGMQTAGGSGPDDGIQAFGTSNAAGSPHYFVKAYFNGESGCNEMNVNVDNIFPGPMWAGDTIPVIGTFAPCGPAGVQLNAFQAPGTINTACYNPSLPGGSNARKAVGIEALSTNAAGISVYPNPVSSIATISVPASVKAPVNVTVFNNLGQKIKDYRFNNTTAGDYAVDLSALQLKAGLYSIQVTAGDVKNNYKVVYEPK